MESINVTPMTKNRALATDVSGNVPRIYYLRATRKTGSSSSKNILSAPGEGLMFVDREVEG